MSAEETKPVPVPTEAPAAAPAPAAEVPAAPAAAAAAAATEKPALESEAAPAPAAETTAEPAAEKIPTEVPAESETKTELATAEAPAGPTSEVPTAAVVVPVVEPAAEKALEAEESKPVEEPKAVETGPLTAAAVAPVISTAAEPAKTEEKAAPAPATTATTVTTAAPSSPLASLWAAAQAEKHPEIWGVTLQDPSTHVPSQIVFQKYLNANDGDLTKAKDQLVKTLQWRAKTQPLALVKKAHSKTKFAGLGYVTSYVEGEGPEGKEVFTWNVYGAAKSIDATFGNLEEFIAWRVALMELALSELSLSTATQPITADHDPYKIFQVHDYKSISFLRQPASSKTASTETIKVFAQNYPELLKEKFFVNVPAIMGFMYSFIKLFVAAKTIKKFHPMSNGAGLAAEFGANTKVRALGEKLPKEYGGKGEDLETQGKECILEDVPETKA